MTRRSSASRWGKSFLALTAMAAAVGLVTAFTGGARGGGEEQVDQAAVLRGRHLVVEHVCGGCHGGGTNPAADGWLTGYTGKEDPGAQDFMIEGFHTYARNLTPDDLTGLGRFSERQIFNALRYGVRPEETPDVEITSSTPGQGNFPKHPAYLAPPMPWPAWRHMSDADLWAIAAYLKHGLKPVRNRVPDSEGPPDLWAGAYQQQGLLSDYPAAPFPTANEATPPAGVDQQQVLRGRQMVIEHACGDCHGGVDDPGAKGWLAGVTSPDMVFVIGACAADSTATPCFRLRPKNLTPDNATGIGRYSERQIYNALKYGLSPKKTPDVEITSGMPGQGNFPAHPTYLGVAMPWPAWRHMPDADLWAVAAYLKHGLKPVSNHVDDSDAPPDAWASAYTPDQIGTNPSTPFPTKNEVGG